MFFKCEDVPLVWRRLLAVAIYTYPREGELRALEWSDVDLEHGIVHVHRARDRRTGKVTPTGLTKAKVTRAELHRDSPTHKRVTWHDARSTGLTWMAVRGDEPLRIQQRARHTMFSTTHGYIRTAEAVGTAFGEPFPKLPRALYELRGEEARDHPIDQPELRMRNVVEAPGN